MLTFSYVGSAEARPSKPCTTCSAAVTGITVMACPMLYVTVITVQWLGYQDATGVLFVLSQPAAYAGSAIAPWQYLTSI